MQWPKNPKKKRKMEENQNPRPEANPGLMTFLEHLEELRKRFVTCAIAVGIGFVICFTFADELFRLLARPLLSVLPEHQGEMIFTGLIEPFLLYIKVGILFGVFVATPVILSQVWAFVSPALRREEKKYAFPFVLFSTIFFLGGAFFGYFVIFPVGFKYFLSLTADFFSPKLAIKEYLGFATRILFAFGIVFELPLLSMLLARMGVIDDAFLKKYWRYAIVLLFIGAAFLTPPDVVSQLLLVGPLVLLYQLSILLAWIFKRRPPAEKE